MAEMTMQEQGTPPSGLGRAWGRLSSRLVPVLAVVTALLITIPFMIVTGGRGDFSRGLQIAGTAYSALIEGSIGLVINDTVSLDDLDQVIVLAAAETQSGGDLDRRDLRRFGLAIGTLVEVGPENARRYAEVLAPFADIEDDEELTELLSGIPEGQAVGAETLNAMRPLRAELEQRNRGDVRAMAEADAAVESLSAEDRAALETLAPSAAELRDEGLLTCMAVLVDQGVVRLGRPLATIDPFEEVGIALDAPEADDLNATAELDDGAEAAREAAATL